MANFARLLVGAVRSSQMYKPGHPASSAALARLKEAVDALQSYPDLTIGVTPRVLMTNGTALRSDTRIAEAAKMLHEHDVLRLRFPSPTTLAVLSDFLRLLNDDAESTRARGGPARIWEEFGHRSVEIDRIDFEALMADRDPAAPGAAQLPSASVGPGPQVAAEPMAHDAIWEVIVRSLSSGRPTKGLSVQQRLLEIARSPDAIETLALEAAGGDEGDAESPPVAAQAATVLTTFQRLVQSVETQSPDEVPGTLRNLAEAASRLDPQIVMRAIAESAESGVGADLTNSIGRWLDDDQVAHMLARSVAAEGKASGRMAAALSTLAPDPARQQRVIHLARTCSKRDISDDTTEFDAAAHSLEQMLRGPGDAAYTSSEYAASLEDAESRSYQLSLTTPAQMDGWIQTVSSDSISALSSVLLLDLFALEERPSRISQTADDVAALAEDLLMAADTAEAERIVHALGAIAAGPSPRHAEAASRAIETIAGSTSMREMNSTLIDFDDVQLAWFERFCHQLGVPALEALVDSIVMTPEGEGRHRLERVIMQFGDDAVAPLARLTAIPNWPVCRDALRCIGGIATAKAIAVLQKFVGGGDQRQAREAVIALVRIDDATALRPLVTALREGPSALRLMVVEALAASLDRRAAPLLVATLDEIDPLGPDHKLSIRVLGALRLVGDDKAVPAIARTLRAWSWRHLTRAYRVKRAAAHLLASINSAASRAALDEATSGGDLLSRMHARTARRAGS